MKKIKFLLIAVLVLLVSGVQPTFAQSKKEKKEQKAKEVKELLDSGSYIIDVTRALPQSGKSINLTSPYSLELKGDSVVSFLPYFGRAYSVPYGGGDGLRFSDALTEKNVTFDKKGTAQITFKSRTKEDNYTFNIKVFSNGSATINVQPINRQSISFQGELVTPREITVNN